MALPCPPKELAGETAKRKRRPRTVGTLFGGGSSEQANTHDTVSSSFSGAQ